MNGDKLPPNCYELKLFFSSRNFFHVRNVRSDFRELKRKERFCEKKKRQKERKKESIETVNLQSHMLRFIRTVTMIALQFSNLCVRCSGKSLKTE